MNIIIRVLLFFIVLGLLLFLSAGSLRYYEAWIFVSVLFIMGPAVITYFFRKDPSFAANRLLRRREKEPAHRRIQILFLPLFLITFLIPGLDFRFHWSFVPTPLVILSNIMVVLGYLIMAMAMEHNRFASSIIEISKNQKVINTGPYRIVRHPMYTGGMIFFLFTPMALGSFWAVLPFGIVTAIPIVLRILNEEKLLMKDLTGYYDYCQKTKYRLIPYVW